jgi:hypothetical protein
MNRPGRAGRIGGWNHTRPLNCSCLAGSHITGARTTSPTGRSCPSAAKKTDSWRRKSKSNLVDEKACIPTRASLRIARHSTETSQKVATEFL